MKSEGSLPPSHVPATWPYMSESTRQYYWKYDFNRLFWSLCIHSRFGYKIYGFSVAISFCLLSLLAFTITSDNFNIISVQTAKTFTSRKFWVLHFNVGLGALYGPLILHLASASVHHWVVYAFEVQDAFVLCCNWDVKPSDFEGLTPGLSSSLSANHI
jgi:hypothetical protein